MSEIHFGTGIVREWRAGAGWGVIDSPETAGGCLVIFESIQTPGFKSLTPGETVDFEWITASQEGFTFRAERVWPGGITRDDNEQVDRSGDAYSSELLISFDEERPE